MNVLGKKSVEDIDVKGKRVLVRCDFNVPLEGGVITSDKRIVASLPTIQYLLGQGAAVILCSHLGRPKGAFDPAFSLKPVAARLSELLARQVKMAADVVGESAQSLAENLQPSEVLLLENVRFEPGETKNDPALSKQFAALADIFVNDAFGSAHRAHSSTEGVSKFLPSVCGFLIEKELTVMGGALDNPKRPFIAILGGAKVSDKIGVINNLMDKVDKLIVGGGMAYTFYKARGGKIGTSICEDDKLEVAAAILKKAKENKVNFILPLDNVVGNRFANDTDSMVCPAGEFPDGYEGMDIGPKTRELFAAEIEGAGTIVWNGPMGVFEFEKFAGGTRAIAKAVSESGAVSIIGGGDSAAAVEKLGYADKVTHISTGGGASLEFLEGLVLPGIACLMDK